MWKSPVYGAVNVEVSSFVCDSNKTRNSLGSGPVGRVKLSDDRLEPSAGMHEKVAPARLSTKNGFFPI